MKKKSNKKNNKKMTTIIIILSCIILVYGIKLFTQSSAQKDFKSSKSSRIKGEAMAPIQIVEFIDFECPACAAGAKYLKKVMQKNPSSIHLEMKYYPLAMHKHGVISAKYAECAGKQGKFWEFHDYLIERQKLWHRLDDANPAFDVMAQDLKLDMEALKSCVESLATAKVIEKDKAEGRSIGIRSTPTYFVNGEIVVGMRNLQVLIEELLDEKG